jgi:hypothetical protein
MYIKDVNSPAALGYLKQNKSALYTSTLTELEFFNAAERRLGRKQLIRSEVDQAYASFESDVGNGVLRVIEVEPAVWIETRRLILRHTASVGCRTADIIHLAAAVVMQADKILTFDLRQRALASRLKLKIN